MLFGKKRVEESEKKARHYRKIFYEIQQIIENADNNKTPYVLVIDEIKEVISRQTK